MNFTPSRLTLARKRRGFTIKELSTLTTISIRSLSAYEGGRQSPNRLNVERLAESLNFPSGFFSGPDLEEPPRDAASFRAMSRLSAYKQDEALSAGALAYALDDWITERFDRAVASVPQLRAVGPETAAMAVREEWGLGEKPIKNMIHLLERNGVRIFSLAEEWTQIDAFSVWRGSIPYIFLNTTKTAERSRFDAAHELGHLVLHWHHGTPGTRECEKEANQFASALLMPRGSVLGSVKRGAKIDELIRAKLQWRVSVKALAYRMLELGLLTDWEHRSIYQTLHRRGYATSEPKEIGRESSYILAKVLDEMRTEGISKKDIANELAIPSDEIDKLMFGLVLTVLAGGKKHSQTTSSQRPNLRVVN